MYAIVGDVPYKLIYMYAIVGVNLDEYDIFCKNSSFCQYRFIEAFQALSDLNLPQTRSLQ